MFQSVIDDSFSRYWRSLPLIRLSTVFSAKSRDFFSLSGWDAKSPLVIAKRYELYYGGMTTPKELCGVDDYMTALHHSLVHHGFYYFDKGGYVCAHHIVACRTDRFGGAGAGAVDGMHDHL